MINNFSETIEKVKPFIKEITNKTAIKAVDDMARSFTSSLFESDINFEDFILSYKKDEIFNPDCLFDDQSNLFNFIHSNYKSLSKVLFSSRPIGLGTPNAMVGEGEFMCLLLSPRVGISKKKDSGDITVDDRPIEMKGEQVRIFGNITGVELQNHAKSIAETFNVEPNPVVKDRKAFEPWGTSPTKLQHWKEQFKHIGKDNALDFLATLFQKPKEIFTECFEDDNYDAKILNKVILKMLFRDMTKKWEAFTMIDSDGRITTITTNLDEFDSKVDSDKIYVTGDYFRSFQNNNIGLYCEHI
jgi:hypothetical protein